MQLPILAICDAVDTLKLPPRLTRGTPDIEKVFKEVCETEDCTLEILDAFEERAVRDCLQDLTCMMSAIFVRMRATSSFGGNMENCRPQGDNSDSLLDQIVEEILMSLRPGRASILQEFK